MTTKIRCRPLFCLRRRVARSPRALVAALLLASACSRKSADAEPVAPVEPVAAAEPVVIPALGIVAEPGLLFENARIQSVEVAPDSGALGVLTEAGELAIVRQLDGNWKITDRWSGFDGVVAVHWSESSLFALDGNSQRLLEFRSNAPDPFLRMAFTEAPQDFWIDRSGARAFVLARASDATGVLIVGELVENPPTAAPHHADAAEPTPGSPTPSASAPPVAPGTPAAAHRSHERTATASAPNAPPSPLRVPLDHTPVGIFAHENQPVIVIPCYRASAVFLIDRKSLRTERVELPGFKPVRGAFIGNEVALTSASTARLMFLRTDDAAGTVRMIELPQPVHGASAFGGSLFLSAPAAGSIFRLDAPWERVTETAAGFPGATDFTAGAEFVWVVSAADSSVAFRASASALDSMLRLDLPCQPASVRQLSARKPWFSVHLNRGCSLWAMPRTEHVAHSPLRRATPAPPPSRHTTPSRAGEARPQRCSCAESLLASSR